MGCHQMKVGRFFFGRFLCKLRFQSLTNDNSNNNNKNNNNRSSSSGSGSSSSKGEIMMRNIKILSILS